jgi:hypothetical protein
MKEMLQRPTLLTRKDLSVVEILNEKALATGPELAVDYFEYTDTLISNELDQIAQAEKELKLLKANLKSERERIKIGAAQWLASMGVEKLDGIRVSSLTKYTPASSEKLIIHDEDCLFLKNKDFLITTLDEKAVIDFLKNTEIDYSEFVELETVHKEDVCKINKRKA